MPFYEKLLRFRSEKIEKYISQLVAEGEVITNLYSSEYGLVITEPEATNCFLTNFQVFAKNNQHNFIKILFKFIAVSKTQKP